jgi:hypothetical protein
MQLFLVLLWMQPMAFTQDPLDPFDSPFEESTADPHDRDSPPLLTDDQAAISLRHGGRITVVGPDDVPHLVMVGTLRLDSRIISEQSVDQEPSFHVGDSELRIDGSALEDNHYRFRFDLDGQDSAGLCSEAWIDRKIRNRLHMSFGRIPTGSGLAAGLPLEDRLTISEGLIDWLSEGSSWAIRTGGRWLDGAIVTDLQGRIGGAADPSGEFYGGRGLSGRLSIQPFSKLIFGGPDSVETPTRRFSMFISGRWDHDASGRIQVRSAGETTLIRTQRLHVRSSRWVRAGWRWPLLDWLHVENEWMQLGFHGIDGIDSGLTSTDMPGEFSGWQVGVRALLSGQQALVTRAGPDLPPAFFDEPGAFDRSELEVLLRYERVHMGDQLHVGGLLEAGSVAGSAQVVKLALGARTNSWLRWILEGAWTSTDEAMSSFGDDQATSLRLMLEIGG